MLVNVFFPPSTCGEMLDSALHLVALAIGLHRVHRVVVGGPRLEAVHTHAENGIGMARVQPDWRLRRLAEVREIGTVTHDSKMLRRTAWIVTCPSDDGRVVVSRFELWPLGDPDARSFFSSRTLLRGCWGGVEQASDDNRYR